MKKHISEIEMYQEALSKIRINEATIPIHNGRIVEDADTYAKVEKLLASPEMEQSHMFLYDIDFNQLDDETIKKVDELYNLAIKQGLIDGTNEDELNATSTVEETPDGVSDNGEVSEILPSARNVVNCYTCFYSAIKNGEIKTGECYSNSPTPEQAKIDAISKLTKIGFSDINIIAIETGDTDIANCDQFAHTIDKTSSTDVSSNETITEDVSVVDEAETCPKCHARTLEKDPHSGNMRCSRCNYWKKTGGLDKNVFLYHSKDLHEDESSDDNEDKKEPETDDAEENNKSSEKEPSHQEKVELFARFFKAFKDLLIKMKQTSYKNFDINGKAEFWNNMSNIWNEKYDPRDFMSPANIEKLENLEIKIK